MLYNHYHGNTINEGDLFLLDTGAETEMGYAGDLTSTFPVSPTFTDRQKDIYEIMYHAYEAAVDALAPGVPNKDVHFTACRVIFEGMKELGIMKGDTEEALAAGAHALVMPHGIGHMMGMDVHDMENLGEAYVGYLPDEEFYGLLEAAHAVMSLTTQDHTFQSGASEALWLGKPIITSDWPLLRAYFDRGTVHVDNTVQGIRRGIVAMQRDLLSHQAGILTLQEEQLV